MDDRVDILGIPLPRDVIEMAARLAVGATSSARVRLRLGPANTRVNGRVAISTLIVDDRELPIVVKVVASGLREAEAYRALAAGGAPVAQLYAWFSAADGREVLLLEHFPRIGIDGGEHEFGRFIDALATLNATSAPTLPTVAPTWLRDWLAAAQRAWQRAQSGAWGEAMRQAAMGLERSWPALDELAIAIQRELAALPLDATHQDPNHENCGWRQDGTLVFFDLASAARYAAFADLALVLGGATQAWPATRGRGPWIERYRAAYARRRAAAPSLATIARAVDLHIAACAMWFDDLLFARADAKFTADPHVGGDTLDWYRRKWRRLQRMLEIGIGGAAEP